MKRSWSLFAILVLIAAFVLSACAQQATPTTSSGEGQTGGEAKEVTAIIGYTASQTGKLTEESNRQVNGQRLWMKQVNERGGIKLSDGSVVKFEEKYYDDESTKERVQELYVKLATDDKATFLISPYSSGLADAAAVIAEQYGKIMITTGAASDSTYQKGYTLVFQAYTPASAYMAGAVDMLGATDPAAKKIAIVHENEKFSTDVVTFLKTYAESKGYEIVLFEGYDSSTTDFAPFINKIQAATPDALMGGGHFQDGSTFARQLAEKNVPIKFVGLLVAPAVSNFAELGDAAVGIIGPSQWEPQVSFSAETAGGKEFYGPSSAEFTAAYKAEYGEDPTYHAAGGYAAGLLLEKAILNAGTLDTQAVKTALDNLDILTFYGGIKFDTGASHGLQTGHSMVYIQWQKDASGNLVKQVVWPKEGASAELIYPLR